MYNENHENEIDLIKTFATLLDNKVKILALTGICTLLGIAYSIFATPVYTANATIQVEEKSSGSALSIVKDFSQVFEPTLSYTTEMTILKSRMVIGNTVEQLNLTTHISPLYTIPFLSKGIARLSGNLPELKVDYFILKKTDLDSLILEVITENEQYRLINPETKAIIAEGRVGQIYSTDSVQIKVSKLYGKPNQKFNISKQDKLVIIENLQNKLFINEKGKKTGIIEISLNGENKEEIKAIVKNISENYLLQNIARNSAKVLKGLEFLQQQLPQIKQKLSEAENRLNDFRKKNKSIDLNLETKSALDSIVQLEANLNELTIKESEISQKFTKNHPAYISLIDKRKVLLAEQRRLNQQLEALPDTQKDIVRLIYDLEVNQQIYVQFLNKIQELNVIKAGAVGNVRILDNAQILPNLVSPKKFLITLVSAILGFVLSLVYVFIKTLLNKGIQLPSQIDKLGIPVYASIPYSKAQPEINVNKFKSKKGEKRLNKGLNNSKLTLLSESNPADLAIEALRSVRTSLHFAMMGAKNNIIMISGASPNVGKSFIATNLANLSAKAGQKVLLIDADLRKSYLRHILNLKISEGFTDAITKDIPFAQVVKASGSGNFDVIIKGGTPSNPSELLLNIRCQQLLKWASTNYDLVIVDTPPILAVTDAAIIGRYVGTTLLVGKFEKTTTKEVEITLRRFEQAGIKIKGFILNGVKPRASNYYEYYRYDYT